MLILKTFSTWSYFTIDVIEVVWKDELMKKLLTDVKKG